MVRTQQYIKLNTGEKEFQHLNQGGPETAKASGPNHLINRLVFKSEPS